MREVRERVVHPAHVPLEAEAEPALVDRPRDAGPRRRLLGDRQHAGLAGVRDRVQLLEELDRLQVLVAAVVVRHPLAGACASSRGRASRRPRPRAARRCGTLQPEQGAREQEVAHLVAAVVEDERAPVGMLALARVGVLVQVRCRRSRRAPQSSLGKCAGTQSRITPIPARVQLVDEVRKSSGVPNRAVGAK